ncbi:MAC/Perforin domain-containing protein [Chitinophaga sp. YR627]|uniref:MAC/perforin domain-containing protein n=1 Tax=Chitinophaga sp. YR627 TaxID=1881041 RepID=UPI0008F01D40|nr:MAC/perforin domain-containing protein [Chitinophaga sp. YR627]SFO73916.1 MAC/Perforin domain-containing protein [Chitinophaga sp. YR627]
MKKVVLLCLVAFSVSCRKEAKQDELIPNENRTPTIAAAGDGVYDVIGYGYDVTGVFADASSSRNPVIDFAAFQAANPGRVNISYPNTQDFYYEYGADAASLMKKISASLSATATYTAFSGTLKGSYNSTNTFSSKDVYGICNLLVKSKQIELNTDAATLKNYLTPEFKYDLANLPVSTIVARYGTHVHVNIITGGKLEIIYKSETKSERRMSAAAGGLNLNIKKVFGFELNIGVDKSASDSNFTESVSYRTRGGGFVAVATINPTTGTTFDPSNWQKSVTLQNSVLVEIPKQGLIAITDLIDDQSKKAELAAYVDQYIKDNAVNLQYAKAALYSYLYVGKVVDILLTTTPTEVAGVAGWQSGSVIGTAFTDNSMPGVIPIYRYFQNNKTHFFTNDFNEIGYGGQHGKYEWVAGYIYRNPTPGAVPIYRYNASGMHWYTTTYNGQSFKQYNKTYVYESILGYLPQN